MVNPVAGFFLPDHIDEALEVFDAAGNPLGQLFHEPISGGVTWEIAPGRDGPPDAGPLHGLDPGPAVARPDVGGGRRQGRRSAWRPRRQARATRARFRPCCAPSTRRCGRSTPSRCSARRMSRAWSAGPIAVVRATLRLDIRERYRRTQLCRSGAAGSARSCLRRLSPTAPFRCVSAKSPATMTACSASSSTTISAASTSSTRWCATARSTMPAAAVVSSAFSAPTRLRLPCAQSPIPTSSPRTKFWCDPARPCA